MFYLLTNIIANHILFTPLKQRTHIYSRKPHTPLSDIWISAKSQMTEMFCATAQRDTLGRCCAAQHQQFVDCRICRRCSVFVCAYDLVEYKQIQFRVIISLFFITVKTPHGDLEAQKRLWCWE